MGRMKQLAIELEEAEMALDFDEQNHVDTLWWTDQDAAMVMTEKRDRLEALEIEAEIFELRCSGQM